MFCPRPCFFLPFKWDLFRPGQLLLLFREWWVMMFESFMTMMMIVPNKKVSYFDLFLSSLPCNFQYLQSWSTRPELVQACRFCDFLYNMQTKFSYEKLTNLLIKPQIAVSTQKNARTFLFIKIYKVLFDLESHWMALAYHWSTRRDIHRFFKTNLKMGILSTLRVLNNQCFSLEEHLFFIPMQTFTLTTSNKIE